MVKLNESGAATGWFISLALSTILLIAAIIFGAWAYSGRQDYKNNVDVKIGAAVAAAKQQEDSLKAKQYAEAAKNPLATYTGPEAYGSIILQYPKTWSGYVDTSGTGSALVDGYFSPGVVPAIGDPSSVFALHVQVLNQSYASSLQTFQSQVQSNGLTVTAYALPKLPKVTGVEVTGQISGSNGPNQTMVVMPLRSQTIELSTQGTQYLSDFNNYILPNFSFSP